MRIVAMVLGLLACIAGVSVLILAGTSVISSASTIPGGLLVGCGLVSILVALLKKKPANLEPNKPSEISNSIDGTATQQFLQTLPDLIDFEIITPQTLENITPKTLTTYVDVGCAKCTEVGDIRFAFYQYESAHENGPLQLVWCIRLDSATWGTHHGYLRVNDQDFQHSSFSKENAISEEIETIEHFSNLKLFFDYLFQGRCDSCKTVQQFKYITLFKDGKKFRYNNPFLADQSST